jgi:hypothetical protein
MAIRAAAKDKVFMYVFPRSLFRQKSCNEIREDEVEI